jgi:hypothetical protein
MSKQQKGNLEPSKGFIYLWNKVSCIKISTTRDYLR